MQVRVGCEFEYEPGYPVPMVMLVRPRPDGEPRVDHEQRWLDPDAPLHEYRDAFGNEIWRFVAPAGRFTIRYDALVEIDPRPEPVHPDLPLTPVDELPDDTLVFTLPSRYIESDLLIPRAWELFGNTPPTWARVQAVCDWIHTNVAYTPGCSTPTTTAMDVHRSGVAVCRDFAQLAVGFCRALNVPARYTFGYLPDIGVPPPDSAQDFHAWFEAFVGGEWWAFDARFNTPRIGRIPIGRGRDAVDVALSTAWGSAPLNRMTVWSDEVTESNPGGPPDSPRPPLATSDSAAITSRGER